MVNLLQSVVSLYCGWPGTVKIVGANVVGWSVGVKASPVGAPSRSVGSAL